MAELTFAALHTHKLVAISCVGDTRGVEKYHIHTHSQTHTLGRLCRNVVDNRIKKRNYTHRHTAAAAVFGLKKSSSFIQFLFFYYCYIFFSTLLFFLLYLRHTLTHTHTTTGMGTTARPEGSLTNEPLVSPGPWKRLLCVCIMSGFLFFFQPRKFLALFIFYSFFSLSSFTTPPLFYHTR